MAQLTVPDAPVIIVLFGATGDLAKRMVLPAFYTLAEQKLMPEDFVLIGTGRSRLTDDQFRVHIRDALTEFASAPAAAQWSGSAGGCASPVVGSPSTTPANFSTR